MKPILYYSCLFLFLLTNKNSIDAQSKIDSIKLEVIALNESYHQKLTELYKEMFELSRDTTNKEYFMARFQFHLFPIEENMNYLLDNINYQVYSDDDDFEEMYPYWASFGKFIYENGQLHPALIEKIMIRLDQQQTDENLFLFSVYFKSFFYWSLMNSMNNEEVAACLRIMANSIRGVSQRRENLIRIADILENK